MPVQGSYAYGVSTTEIGAMFRNGCLVSGESRWIPPSVGESLNPRPFYFLNPVFGLIPFFSHRLISTSSVASTCIFGIPQISQLAESLGT